MLIIFGTNIPDTTGHHLTIPALPNVCFCITLKQISVSTILKNQPVCLCVLTVVTPDVQLA